jgi:superfamily II DNA or RNA helicase
LEVHKSLNEILTFEVPNAKFTPQYKARVWDGKIRLYNTRDMKLLIGHIETLNKFCDKNGYEIEVDSEVYKQVINDDYNEKAVDDFIDSLDLSSYDKKSKEFEKIEPYPEQRMAVHTIIKDNRRLMLSPTSSGKSLIAYIICRWYIHNKKKGQFLITVPTTMLVEQMLENFKEYSEYNGWDADAHTHVIYAGKDKKTKKKIVVSTWQSIYKLQKPYFKNFSLAIADECHNVQGKSLQAIYSKLVNANIRVGMTGTLSGMKCSQIQIEGYMGLTKTITTIKELTDNKRIAKPKVKSIFLDYPKAESFDIKKFTYQEEIKYLNAHEKRTNILTKVFSKLKGNVLILFANVAHGQMLYDDFQKYGTESYIITGKHGTVTAHNAITDLMDREDGIVTFATYSKLSTGISIKNIQYVVFASPSKSQIRVLQSLGRGLRKHKTKDKVTIVDFVDDLTYLKRGGKNTHENYAYQHGLKRLEIYMKAEIDYEIKKLKV